MILKTLYEQEVTKVHSMRLMLLRGSLNLSYVKHYMNIWKRNRQKLIIVHSIRLMLLKVKMTLKHYINIWTERDKSNIVHSMRLMLLKGWNDSQTL